MGSLAKGFLRKVCGNSAEILRKVRGNYVLLRQERARKFCGKFAEIRVNLRKLFCNDPFPNDPVSELLTLGGGNLGGSVHMRLGNYIFVPVLAGGHFFKMFRPPPHGPYDFPGNTSKIIRTGDFST